jgi:hypothetical protein
MVSPPSEPVADALPGAAVVVGAPVELVVVVGGTEEGGAPVVVGVPVITGVVLDVDVLPADGRLEAGALVDPPLSWGAGPAPHAASASMQATRRAARRTKVGYFAWADASSQTGPVPVLLVEATSS